MRSIPEIEIWVCFISGALFICYALFAFVQWKIHNVLRLSLSAIFAVIGCLGITWGSKLVYGEQISYTLVTIILLLALTVLGGIVVCYLYKRNQKISNYCEKKNL